MFKAQQAWLIYPMSVDRSEQCNGSGEQEIARNRKKHLAKCEKASEDLIKRLKNGLM
jgi:hypothetical protein